MKELDQPCVDVHRATCAARHPTKQARHASKEGIGGQSSLASHFSTTEWGWSRSWAFLKLLITSKQLWIFSIIESEIATTIMLRDVISDDQTNTALFTAFQGVLSSPQSIVFVWLRANRFVGA